MRGLTVKIMQTTRALKNTSTNYNRQQTVRENKAMTEIEKEYLYARLVAEVVAYAKEGQRITRFQVLKILDGWTGQIDRNYIDLAEKLYTNGLVDE